jgi:hypothetical protein
MPKKQNRRARRSQQAQGAQPGQRSSRSKRKRFLNTPSLIFIGLIVLMVGVIAAASFFRGDTPKCPPGQVWSDAHGHCH